MKLADQLSSEQRKKLEKLHHRKKPPSKKKVAPKKKKEKLSNADLRDLMGTNRDTYKRVRGAIRRK